MQSHIKNHHIILQLHVRSNVWFFVCVFLHYRYGRHNMENKFFSVLYLPNLYINYLGIPTFWAEWPLSSPCRSERIGSLRGHWRCRAYESLSPHLSPNVGFRRHLRILNLGVNLKFKLTSEDCRYLRTVCAFDRKLPTSYPSTIPACTAWQRLSVQTKKLRLNKVLD